MPSHRRKRTKIVIKHIPISSPRTIAVTMSHYTTHQSHAIGSTSTTHVPVPELPALPASCATSSTPEPLGTQAAPSVRQHKTTSQLLAHLTAHETEFLDELLRAESDENVNRPCTRCLKEPATIRCDDCFQSPIVCPRCIIETHSNNPLHRVRQWTGTHFANKELKDLGLILHLGHYGAPCRHAATSDVSNFVITDDNGVHNVRLAQCHCADRPPLFRQLVRAGLFPATTERPRSAFTHRVLRNFHKLSNESGATAYSHFMYLSRLTDDVTTGNVPDRSREFLRAARIWCQLQDKKQSGQA